MLRVRYYYNTVTIPLRTDGRLVAVSLLAVAVLVNKVVFSRDLCSFSFHSCLGYFGLSCLFCGPYCLS